MYDVKSRIERTLSVGRKDKDQRALEQLANAKSHYECDKSMLALHTRRLGPSTLLTRKDYVTELQALLRKYTEVDHFACKDYFGEVTIVPAP